MTKEIGNKITKIREALNTKFLEREELIDGMLCAVLAGEMLFMLGVPGTAKSAVCQSLCKAIGGNYFSWLMTKFTTPEEIFGPFSLAGIKAGRYERVVANKLPEASIAFFDEIWKTSSALGNTLLTVLNERVFYDGSTPIKIPLKCAFAASNEIPQTQELSALYDRFALRFQVDRIREDDNMKRLLLGDIDEVVIPELTASELDTAQAEVDAIAFTDEIVDKLLALRRAINDQGVFVSDRKWRQAIKIIKAYAYINGNTTEVTSEDLMILRHVFWETPEQIKTVARTVNGICNPLGEKLWALEDAIVQAKQEIDADRDMPIQEVFEQFKKIQKVNSDLEEFQKAQPGNKRIAQVIAKANTIMADIATQRLGLKKP
jgi:MoxR-like ATPase